MADGERRDYPEMTTDDPPPLPCETPEEFDEPEASGWEDSPRYVEEWDWVGIVVWLVGFSAGSWFINWVFDVLF